MSTRLDNSYAIINNRLKRFTTLAVVIIILSGLLL